MKKIVLFLCFSLCSCMGFGKVVLWEENSTAFRQMLAVSRPALMKYEIIDENGSWFEPVLVNPFNKTTEVKYAEIILERLSPSFLYPNADPKHLPVSLKEMFSTGEKLAIGSHALRIERATEIIEAELIARYDDKNKIAHWLVQCKVTNLNTNASTLYYLLMNDPLNSVSVIPIILAQEECLNNVCTNSGEYIHSGPYDVPTIEVERGEKNILDPGFSVNVEEDFAIKEKKLAN